MVLFPHAKINLGLQVTGKRPDGFHDLVSCFYPITWYDVLEIMPSKKFSFTTTGVSVPGSQEENLCVRAYRLLNKKHSLGAVRMHLHKVIPIGAGLGGGSADAAYTLRALVELFQLDLGQEEMQHMAANLGSDCPFFLQPNPLMVRGKGDILEPFEFSLPPGYLAVIFPGFHISTKEAFAELRAVPPHYDLGEVIMNTPVEDWKDVLTNDFEHTVFRRFPSLEKLKKALYASGAVFASLTGSGAAVYGYFREKPELASAFPPEYIIWEQRV